MNTASTISNGRGWIYLLVMLVFGVIVYRDALTPGHVLFTTDDNIGAMGARKSTFPHAFLGGWDDTIAAGQPMNTPVSMTNMLLMMLSPQIFCNWIHAFNLVVGSWFFMLFLRLRGIGWMAASLGALLTFWLGSTFFLTYAGHIGKFGVVLCAGMYLYLVERAIRDRSVSFAVLAGVAMAGMFIEQSDSALFFATILGPYALFRCWQEYRTNVVQYARVLVPLLVITAMMSIHAVYSAYSFYRMDKPAEAEQQSWQELWDYCTQWSWPPSETIEFLAPGYMGWRSGEPTGPYWGALGRHPQWSPQFGINGINFKLETFYIGFIPLMFLFFGLYASLIRKRDDQAARQAMLFWTGAMAVTFLLALGKYFPLYRIFFELPGVSSIRNPVKFMQITQFAMGIIAACGLDYFLKNVARGPVKNDPEKPVMLSFTKGIFYTAIAMTAITLLMAVRSSGSITAFAAEGWQEMASRIVATRQSAMIHATVLAWIGYGILRLGAAGGQIKNASWRHLGWAVLMVVMVDQLMISRRYVNSVEVASLISKGSMIPDMKQNLGVRRAYCWSPPNTPAQLQNLYNQWMTILFPYHQVPVVNMGVTRMPDDYKAFFEAMSSQPLLMWSHMALGLAVAPAEIRNNSSLRDTFEPLAAYSIVPAGKTGATTVTAYGQQPANIVLLRYLKTSERYALVTAWQAEELNDAVAAMTKLEPLTVAMVDPASTTDWPASGSPGRTGTVNVKSYRTGRIVLDVSTSQAALLRAAEKFTPDWKAFVDGVEVPVHRTDAIFLGVMMEPSEKNREVVLEFRPQRKTLYLQFAGLGIGGLALIGCFFVRRK